MIDRVKVIQSHRINKFVGVLVAIQAIQLSNLLPLLLDPRPEFSLGLLMNSTVGATAVPVAYAVWTRRKHGPLIAVLFAMFSLPSAVYFQYLTVAQYGEAFFGPPVTISLIIMAVDVTVIALLLFFQGRRFS